MLGLLNYTKNYAGTIDKSLTSMISKFEPAKWSRDTGQRIPYFYSCQWTRTWIYNIKEVRYKPRPPVSVTLLAGVWPPSCPTPPSSI